MDLTKGIWHALIGHMFLQFRLLGIDTVKLLNVPFDRVISLGGVLNICLPLSREMGKVEDTFDGEKPADFSGAWLAAFFTAVCAITVADLLVELLRGSTTDAKLKGNRFSFVVMPDPRRELAFASC